METKKEYKYKSSYFDIFDYLLLDYHKDERILSVLEELNKLGYEESNIVRALKSKKVYLDTVKKQDNFSDIIRKLVIEFYKTHDIK